MSYYASYTTKTARILHYVTAISYNKIVYSDFY